MPANVNEWDARHREAAQKAHSEPASIVQEWLPLLPKGPALDLACGTGRHSLLLAAQGRAVTAIDWSPTALDVVAERGAKANLSVSRDNVENISKPGPRGIRVVLANLEEIQLPPVAFSLILCFQYLQRSLFSQIVRALRPGGLLLFETFTQAQLNFTGGPRNPEHLLAPGELRTVFPELNLQFYRELNAGQGISSLVAQKPEKNR